MRLYTLLSYFLQTAQHISEYTLIHHQEHIQTIITTSGTGRTVFATVRWRGGFITAVQTPPSQRTVVNTVRPVPDVVTTFWMCSWWWMRKSSETCRAVCRKYNKTPYSINLLDNYWHGLPWYQLASNSSKLFSFRLQKHKSRLSVSYKNNKYHNPKNFHLQKRENCN